MKQNFGNKKKNGYYIYTYFFFVTKKYALYVNKFSQAKVEMRVAARQH